MLAKVEILLRATIKSLLIDTTATWVRTGRKLIAVLALSLSGGRSNSGCGSDVTHQNWWMIYTLKTNYCPCTLWNIWDLHLFQKSNTSSITLEQEIVRSCLEHFRCHLFFIFLQINHRHRQWSDPHLMFFHTHVLERNCIGSVTPLYVICQ